MRILTWNVRTSGSRVAWNAFLDLEADVALLQEAVVPADVAAHYVVHHRQAIKQSGKLQPWGTSVLVKRNLPSMTVAFTSAKRPWVAAELSKWGAIVPVTIEIGDRKVLVISAYIPAWRVPLGELTEPQKGEVRLRALKGNSIWLADFLWAYLVDELGAQEAIVGGDYNSSVLFDRAHGGSGGGNEEMQDRMTALGLGDLLRVTSPDRFSTPTFLAPSPTFASQL